MATSPLQNAIIAGSIIGSLLAMCDPNVNNKSVAIIRANIKKMMFKRSRSNKKEFLEAVKISDTVWQETINNFFDKKLSLEVLTTSMRIYDIFEAPLTKFANVSHKKIEKMMMKVDERIDADIEANSFIIADFMIDRLSDFTGLTRDTSFKDKIEIMKQENII